MAAQAALDVSGSVSKPSTPSEPSPKTDSVHVAVRVRPLNSNETSQGSATCVDVVDNSVLLAEKQFDFDAAFPPSTHQESIYAELVAPMVDQFFDGYNATVFAYGQTGSGKTYTMGNEFETSVAPTQRGIIPRVMDDVFEKVQASKMEGNIVIKLSYLEILNEEIHDLLVASETDVPTPASTGLSIQGDSERGIVISGLSEHIVESVNHAGHLLRSGALVRATASTNMNSQSSRSHAICTLTMKQCKVTVARGGTETRYSKFHLVDLAGSERVKRTNSQGERFKEGVNINRGLLALGNVINALCERNRSSSAATHVPYRDSKLTRLLQDSLGGNSKTLMIACASPADVNYEETSNTLRYAFRARHIDNEAVINKVRNTQSEVTYLKQQLEIVQLQLLQQSRGIPMRIRTEDCLAGEKSDVSPLVADTLRVENRRLKEELLLANNAKDKWEKIASDLLNKSKNPANERIKGELSRLEPINVTQTSTSIAKHNQGSATGQQSRLEQLRKFQRQKMKSQQHKEGAVKQKADDIDTSNKHRRSLLPNIQTSGRKSLSGKKNSLLPSPSSSSRSGKFDTLSLEDMKRLFQQAMASQEAIYGAKEAIQVNLADRKTIALEISLLENATPSEKMMELTKLRDNLNCKTANIRLLQQKLASVEKNASLPSGLFPVKVETCHQLIRHLIETAIEGKKECMALSRCSSGLNTAQEEVATPRDTHNTEVSTLKTKLAETLTEVALLREQVIAKKKSRKRKTRESYEMIEMLFSSSDEEDDSGADSDYVDEVIRRREGRKKQRGDRTLAPTSSKSKSGDVMEEIDELLDTSAATCCSCHGKCATKACACKSQDRVCSSDCSCNPSKCCNAENDVIPGSNAPGESEALPNDVLAPLTPTRSTTASTQLVPPSVNFSPASAIEELTSAKEVTAPVTIDLMSP